MEIRRAKDSGVVVPAKTTGFWFEGHARHYEVLGDRRTPGVTGSCCLCEQSGPLMLSHVEPKWSYGLIDGDEFFQTVAGMKAKVPRRDGAKAYLLCEECEQHLGQAERYLSHLCKGGSDELVLGGLTLEAPTQAKKDGTRVLVRGCDMTLMCRALVGILLKKHWFDQKHYPDRVKLSNKEVAVLRAALLHDNYPRHKYAIHAIKWFDARPIGLSPKSLIVVSVTESLPRKVEILIGGISFYFYLKGSMPGGSRATNTFPGESLVAGIRGSWTVFCADFMECVHFRSYFDLMFPDFTPAQLRAMFKQQMSSSQLRPEDHLCPCGRPGSRFDSCCEGLWIDCEGLADMRNSRLPLAAY